MREYGRGNYDLCAGNRVLTISNFHATWKWLIFLSYGLTHNFPPSFTLRFSARVPYNYQCLLSHSFSLLLFIVCLCYVQLLCGVGGPQGIQLGSCMGKHKSPPPRALTITAAKRQGSHSAVQITVQQGYSRSPKSPADHLSSISLRTRNKAFHNTHSFGRAWDLNPLVRRKLVKPGALVSRPRWLVG